MSGVSRIVAVIDRDVAVTEFGAIAKTFASIYGDGLTIGQGRWTRFEVRTPGPRCWCSTCEDRDAAVVQNLTGDDMRTLSRFMIVCPECGNKRCPRATSHDEDCTDSNEPGQVGSSYGISRADAFFAEAIAKRNATPARPAAPTDEGQTEGSQ